MINTKHALFNKWVMYEFRGQPVIGLHPFGYVLWEDEDKIWIRDSLGTEISICRCRENLDDFACRASMSGESAGEDWERFINDLFEEWDWFRSDFLAEVGLRHPVHDIMISRREGWEKRVLVEIAKFNQDRYVEAEHAVLS